MHLWKSVTQELHCISRTPFLLHLLWMFFPILELFGVFRISFKSPTLAYFLHLYLWEFFMLGSSWPLFWFTVLWASSPVTFWLLVSVTGRCLCITLFPNWLLLVSGTFFCWLGFLASMRWLAGFQISLGTWAYWFRESDKEVPLWPRSYKPIHILAHLDNAIINLFHKALSFLGLWDCQVCHPETAPWQGQP